MPRPLIAPQEILPGKVDGSPKQKAATKGGLSKKMHGIPSLKDAS
jgi:hypothetical protein